MSTNTFTRGELLDQIKTKERQRDAAKKNDGYDVAAYYQKTLDKLWVQLKRTQ